MTFRLAFLAVFLAIPVLPQTSKRVDDSASRWTATIRVLVRNDRGLPIAGLGPDDFILTEHGERDTVVKAFSFADPEPNGSRPLIESSPASSTASLPVTHSQQAQTWVLVVLAPMSASGRNFAISGLLKFLNQPGAETWHVALFDDEGSLISFGQDLGAARLRVGAMAHHVSAPQMIEGSWITKAKHAIEEVAVRPGMHAIVFASDFEWDVSSPEARNPHLLRVGPSAFIGAAARAQAAMYTIQEGGAGVVVPFGGAAESQYSGSGEQVAEMINMQTVGLGARSSDFLYAAEQTGGHAARDFQDAFADIAADAAGFYQIEFQPKASELDGGWHPISISVRAPHAKIRGPRYYLAPVAESRKQMPLSIAEALKHGASPSGLETSAHVWLFPDAAGVHTGVMAADLRWPAESESAGQASGVPGSRVQIFAQLIDDSMGLVVGSWLSEQEWSGAAGQRQTVHWQREATLYPGSYTLKVIAMDAASGKIGTREYSFLANPSSGRALRFGAVVIADRCVDEKEREGRSNLLDPLLLEGCILAPPASTNFSLSQKPTVLMRVYPPSEKVRALILKQWKAYAVVGSEPPVMLAIRSADVRGLIASGTLPLNKLNPGAYPIKVVFEVPMNGQKYPIIFNSQLTVTP